jgi:hypothetical protein
VGLTWNTYSAALKPKGTEDYLSYEFALTKNVFEYFTKFFIQAFFPTNTPLEAMDKYNRKYNLEDMCNENNLNVMAELIETHNLHYIIAEREKMASHCTKSLEQLGDPIYFNESLFIYKTHEI